MATRETSLGPPVVAWLTEQGWDVYQEVSVGHIADIVAVRERLVLVVELKASFSLDLLAQARGWLGRANLVFVAIPPSRLSTRGGDFGRAICRDLGIGILEVGSSWVERRLDARFARRSTNELRDALRPEHKTFCAAGSSRGGQWSEFKETCRAIRFRVEAEPGITLKQLLTGDRFHYASIASAKQSLTHWLSKGKVAGVEARRDEAGAIRLYPTAKGGKAA